MKCYWHPDRPAEYIVNLGMSIDLDTPACKKCADRVKTGIRRRTNSTATVRQIGVDDEHSHKP